MLNNNCLSQFTNFIIEEAEEILTFHWMMPSCFLQSFFPALEFGKAGDEASCWLSKDVSLADSIILCLWSIASRHAAFLVYVFNITFPSPPPSSFHQNCSLFFLNACTFNKITYFCNEICLLRIPNTYLMGCNYIMVWISASLDYPTGIPNWGLAFRNWIPNFDSMVSYLVLGYFTFYLSLHYLFLFVI